MTPDYTVPLTEHDISVTMARRPDRDDDSTWEERTFTVTVPAVDADHALRGANDLGYCIGVASNWQWKFSGANEPVVQLVATDPMPVFVIKAKDALALKGVLAYLSLCEAEGMVEQTRQVQLALDEMEQWQFDHADQIHLPDHTHVPAGA